MPSAQNNNHPPKNNYRHWLDYAAVAAAGFAGFAAAVAAGVGAWQASVASDTEERQLRAYVGVIPGSVENFGDTQKQKLTFTRKNYGQTPAYNVFLPPANIEIIRFGANLSNIANASFSVNFKELTTIFPTMEFPSYIKGTGSISQQQFELAKKGTEYVMIYYGVIYYDDAFRTPHYTRFCWMFKGESMTSKDVDYCLGHNNSN